MATINNTNDDMITKPDLQIMQAALQPCQLDIAGRMSTIFEILTCATSKPTLVIAILCRAPTYIQWQEDGAECHKLQRIWSNNYGPFPVTICGVHTSHDEVVRLFCPLSSSLHQHSQFSTAGPHERPRMGGSTLRFWSQSVKSISGAESRQFP